MVSCIVHKYNLPGGLYHAFPTSTYKSDPCLETTKIIHCYFRSHKMQFFFPGNAHNRQHTPPFFTNQCNQIWRNFATLAKLSKAVVYSMGVYFVLGKNLNLIGQMFMILDKFSLLLLAQYWKDNLVIWSHCHPSTFSHSCTYVLRGYFLSREWWRWRRWLLFFPYLTHLSHFSP